MTYHNKRIGVLGAGQLGKMMIQDASKMGIHLHLMDQNVDMPGAQVCPYFFEGDIQSYEDVMAFGQDKDILTIEIEAVNHEALIALEKQGKEVYPQPAILSIIKDKGLQKQYYKEHDIATSRFELFTSAEHVREAVSSGSWSIPFVQKAREGGYDGKGVQIVRTPADTESLLDCPCLLEELVEIDKELAVIVGRNLSGEIATYNVAEMEFHPTANLVEFLFTPSSVTLEIQQQATQMAISLAESLGIVGLLAVEFFLDKSGQLYINEVAPRPHNSGHHTIEGAITSQFEQHIRCILGMPLGDTSLVMPAVMVNVTGEPGYSGPVKYEGLQECLSMPGVHPHLYGKATTKPHRKMGHVTIVHKDLGSAKNMARKVSNILKVISE